MKTPINNERFTKICNIKTRNTLNFYDKDQKTEYNFEQARSIVIKTNPSNKSKIIIKNISDRHILLRILYAKYSLR